MRTTQSYSYLPPSDTTIQKAAHEVGLKIKAPDFVRDVCNIRAGGSFLTDAELDHEIDLMVRETPIQKRSNDGQANPNSPYTNKKYVYVNPANNQAFNTPEEAKQDFRKCRHQLAEKIKYAVDRLPRMDVPGGNPTTQAVNLLKLLSDNKGENTDGSPGGMDDYLSSILSKENIDEASKALEQAKELTDSERQMLEELQEIQTPDVPEGSRMDCEGNVTEITARGKSIMKAAAALTDKQLAIIVKVSRRLKAMSKLKTSKQTQFVPDTSETDVRNIAMKSYSELGRIKASQFGLLKAAKPLFQYRATSQQLILRERGKHTDQKQLLYMLIDCSGSMRSGIRTELASGILVNRLLAVSAGDATLYWRFFDTKTYDATYVETKEQAKASIAKIRDKANYSGGGTNFDQAIIASVAHIEKLSETMNFVKPEIMMVTDGDCNCNLKYDALKGIKLHTAIVDGSQVIRLTELSKESGGAVLHMAGMGF